MTGEQNELREKTLIEKETSSIYPGGSSKKVGKGGGGVVW